MAITDAELDAIDDAATTNAGRGANDVSIGDRRVTYADPLKLLEAKRALTNEEEGGVFHPTFIQKGYF
jgi:hypothetical protein